LSISQRVSLKWRVESTVEEEEVKEEEAVISLSPELLVSSPARPHSCDLLLVVLLVATAEEKLPVVVTVVMVVGYLMNWS